MGHVIGHGRRARETYPTIGGRGGGGGADVPFKETYYTDPGTLVPVPQQNGSDEAPFSTIQAALNAATLAGLTSVNIILTGVFYTEPNITVTSGTTAILTTTGLSIIVNGLTLPNMTALGLQGGAIFIGGLTLGDTCSLFGAGTIIALGTVTFGSNANISIEQGSGSSEFVSAGTDGGLSFCSATKPGSPVFFPNICNSFNCPGVPAVFTGTSIASGLNAKSASLSNCTVAGSGNPVTATGLLVFANVEFVPSITTVTLGVGGAVFQDCEFRDGPQFTLDNTASVAEFDLYSWQRFVEAGCTLTTPANVKIVGEGFKASVSVTVPAIAPLGSANVTSAVPGATVDEAVVVNAVFATDVLIGWAAVTAPGIVTVNYRSLAGTVGETVTAIFQALL